MVRAAHRAQTRKGDEMKVGATHKEERHMQRKLLSRLYPDYDAKRHDAFVIRYNADREKEALEKFHRTFGLAGNTVA